MDATAVCWADLSLEDPPDPNAIDALHGSVWRLYKSGIGDGGSPEALRINEHLNGSLAVGSYDVFIATCRTVWSVPKNVADPFASIKLAEGLGVVGGPLSDQMGGLYVADIGGGTIWRFPNGMDAGTSLASSGISPLAMATDLVNIYWTNYSATDSDSGTRSVMMADKLSPGSYTVCAPNQLGPGDIAVDDDHVYRTDTQAGRVLRAAKSGKKVEELASGLAYPGRIVLDADHIYWVNSGNDPQVCTASDAKSGSVMSLHK